MKDFVCPLALASSTLLALLAAAGAGAQVPPPSSQDLRDIKDVRAIKEDGGAQVGSGVVSAPYQFAIAKVLAQEGALKEAAAAFAEAERLAPGSPYIHLEHGQVLLRMAQVTSPGAPRAELLQQAANEVSKARQLAPENPDALRAVASVYLEMATRDPQALEVVAEALEGVHRAEPNDMPVALTLSRLYLERNQPDKAAKLLSELIANEPQQLPAYSLLAEALVRADKPREAEDVLAKYLAIDPSVLETRLMLAELEDRRGDYPAALATLREAPEPAQADPRWKRQAARALYFSGDLAGAEENLRPLLESDTNDPQLTLLAGLVANADGRHDAAVAAFRKLQGLRPGDVSIAVALARALGRAGHLDEAAKLLDDQAADLARRGRAKEAGQVRLELAQLLAERQDWARLDGVLTTLKAGLPAGDDGKELGQQADLLAVDSLLARDRFDDALRRLEAPAGAPPALPALVAKRAEALIKAGRQAEGRAALSELAGRGDAQSVLAAVQAYHRLEQYGESIPLLAKLPRQKPEALWIGFLLGSAYERSGRPDLAVPEFRRALEIDPDYAPALNYLGYLFAEKGEHLDEALRLTSHAVALDPDNGAYVDSLGWVFYQMGKKAEARATLERAVRLEEEDANVREHLGDVYVALGEVAKARATYERALALAKGDKVRAAAVERKLTGLRAATVGR